VGYAAAALAGAGLARDTHGSVDDGRRVEAKHDAARAIGVFADERDAVGRPSSWLELVRQLDVVRDIYDCGRTKHAVGIFLLRFGGSGSGLTGRTGAADFDTVLAVYDDLGDVQAVPFEELVAGNRDTACLAIWVKNPVPRVSAY